MENKCQFTWMTFLWILFPLTFSIFIWNKYYRLEEPFLSTQDTQNIIDVYNAILKRNPTNDELKKYVRALDKKEYPLSEIELRLYNSDEYKRLVKTQSDILAPETTRMLQEKEVIDYVKTVYLYAFQKKPAKELLLPLKDLFIYFDFNPYKLLALFRHSKYKDFEEDFKVIKNLNKETLIDFYLATFDDIKLTQDGEALKKTEKLAALSKAPHTITGIAASANGSEIGLNDTDTNKLLQYLLSKGLYLTDKDKLQAGKELAGTEEQKGLVTQTATGASSYCTGQRVYLTPDAKLVDTGYGFSVPQRHPPVCIPLTGKNIVNPVVFGNYNGTPLEEANQTQVGSIMPMFEYREYIDIPPMGIPPKAVETRQIVPIKVKETLTEKNAPAAMASQKRAKDRAAGELYSSSQEDSYLVRQQLAEDKKRNEDLAIYQQTIKDNALTEEEKTQEKINTDIYTSQLAGVADWKERTR